MNKRTTRSPLPMMSWSIMLVPFIVLTLLAMLSLAWRDGSFSIDSFFETHTVIMHIVVTVILYVAYYLILSKARRAIKSLDKDYQQSLAALDEQKNLLHLETYQHHKTSSELHQLKTKDTLTKVHNQTYFQELLNSEVERTRRYGSDFSILIIELDNFIKLHHEYGNEFSDFAIQKFTQLIEQRLRKSDLLTRYGRQNLAIIAPNTNIEASKIFAIRLCSDIELASVTYESVPLRITLSIGVGAPNASKELSAAALLLATEKALETAKSNGGNQVIDIATS